MSQCSYCKGAIALNSEWISSNRNDIHMKYHHYCYMKTIDPINTRDLPTGVDLYKKENVSGSGTYAFAAITSVATVSTVILFYLLNKLNGLKTR